MGTAVLNTRQEFHRSLSPVTLRWAVFYTNVTSDNCPARFQYPLLPTNQYSIQYYPIVINAIHCYSILSTSSAPTEILWAFQTSPGELFKSWKVPTLSPVPGSYTTWITVHQSSQRGKNWGEQQRFRCCSKYFNIIWTHNALRFRAKKPNSQGVENNRALIQIQIQYMVMSQLIKEVSSELLIHS